MRGEVFTEFTVSCATLSYPHCRLSRPRYTIGIVAYKTKKCYSRTTCYGTFLELSLPRVYRLRFADEVTAEAELLDCTESKQLCAEVRSTRPGSTFSRRVQQECGLV